MSDFKGECDLKMSAYLESKLSFATEVTEEDRKQLMDLYREVWDEKTSAAMEKIFSWKFESSPFLPEDRLPLLFYRAEGRIVAFLGCVPYLVKHGNQYQHMVWIHDGFSHPSYRSKNLWVSFKMVLENPVVVGVAGDESRKEMWRAMARRLAKKSLGSGQTDIGIYRHLVRMLDLRSSPRVKRLLRVRPLISLANLLWRGYCRMFRSWQVRLSEEGLQIREVDEFGEEINRLWEEVKDDYQIIPKRTDAYLNWRFVAHPTNRYPRFLLECEGEVKGYLVLRVLNREGERIGRIVDLLASRREEKFYRALISFAVEYFRERQADTIQVLETTCPELKKALRKNGFGSRLSKQRPMILQGWQREECIPPELLFNQDSWYFTYADSDGEMLPE